MDGQVAMGHQADGPANITGLNFIHPHPPTPGNTF